MTTRRNATDDQDVLAAIVDRWGLAFTLELLAQVCAETGQKNRDNGVGPLGHPWERNAGSLRYVAANLTATE